MRGRLVSEGPSQQTKGQIIQDLIVYSIDCGQRVVEMHWGGKKRRRDVSK